MTPTACVVVSVKPRLATILARRSGLSVELWHDTRILRAKRGGAYVKG